MQDFERDVLKSFEAMAQEPANDDVTKTCPRCRRIQLLSAFGKHSSRPDGLQAYCKGCMSEMGKKVKQTAYASKAKPEELRFRRANKEEPPAAPEIVKQAIKIPPPMGNIESVSDQELAAALRSRGYNVIASKTIEL